MGIHADHVVGVKNAMGTDGRLGYDLESCGTAPKNSVMTFDQGKRCWINKAIFHLPAASQLRKVPKRLIAKLSRPIRLPHSAASLLSIPPSTKPLPKRWPDNLPK